MKKTLFIFLLIFSFTTILKSAETNHLVISEFAFDTSTAPDGGIIEIYNPTSGDIDITGYRIERDSGGNGNPGDIILLNDTGGDGYIRTTNIIKSHGFFLIVDRVLTTYTNLADFIKTNSISINADDSIALGTGPIDNPTDIDCVDWLGFGTATLFEGADSAPNPPTGGSIERKAWGGATSNSMIYGVDTNHGNAEDSDNNNLDFIIRSTPDWQNTSSQTEAPYFPAIEQISLILHPLSSTIIHNGNTNIPLLSFNLSDNSNNRTLLSVHITNLGNLEPANIASLKLYYDADNNTNYNTADILVANLDYNNAGLWTNNTITFSSNLNQPNGRNFIIVANFSSIISNGRSIQLSIIEKGLSVSSSVSNYTPLSETKFWYTQPSLQIVINEIAWSGTKASSADEWIELYNNENINIDLTGWTLKADDGTPNIPLSKIITNKNFFLIEKGDDTTISNIKADLAGPSGFGSIGNTGENLKLFDNNGYLIDYINCANGWYGGTASPNYISMERKYPNQESSLTNWEDNNGITRNGVDANGTNINGTPRQPNSITPFYNFQVSFSNVKNTNISFVNTNIPILSFHYKELISGLHLQKLKIQNNLDMTYSEISNITLYSDNNTIGKYDGSDVIIDTLQWNGTDAWTNNHLSIPTNSQILIVLNINHNAIDNHKFQTIVPANGMIASGVSPANLPFTNASVQSNVLPEIVTLSLTTNYPTQNYFPAETNIPILSLQYKNNKQSAPKLTNLTITNLGNYTNIPYLNLYTNSIFSAQLPKSSTKLYTNNTLSIPPNTLITLKIDIPNSTNNYNQFFQAKIAQGFAISENSISNTTPISNSGQQNIQVDHIILSFSNLGQQTNFIGQNNVLLSSFSISNDVANTKLSQIIFSNAGTLPNSDITKILILADNNNIGTMTNINQKWFSQFTNTITIGLTNRTILIKANLSSTASTNKTIIPVFIPNGIQSDKIAKGPSIPIISGTNVIYKIPDNLSFDGNSLTASLDVAIEQPVLAFHLKSDSAPIYLTKIILSNKGTLPNTKIKSLTLYKKEDGSISSLTTNDAPIGYFSFTNNLWQSIITNTTEISYSQTQTNFIITLLSTMDFINHYTINFIIPASNIMGTGTGTAPSTIYSNSNPLSLTNALPPAITNFICASTNDSSAILQWSNYPLPKDFSFFKLYYGTNILTNSSILTDGTTTNTIISHLKPNSTYHLKIIPFDLAGQSNTNTPLITIKTKIDTNAPLFDESSIIYTINKKNLALSWSPATDVSTPIYYDIFVSDVSNFIPTLPAFSTTNTSYSFALEAGPHYIKIQARDSVGNSTVANRIISVTIQDITTLDKVYFYPNPITGNEIIHLNNFPDTAEIYIYTINGRLVLHTYDKNFSLPENTSSGVYYFVIKNGNEKKIKKLVYIK